MVQKQAAGLLIVGLLTLAAVIGAVAMDWVGMQKRKRR